MERDTKRTGNLIAAGQDRVSPIRWPFLAAGFGLVFTGFLLPFLMVLRLLEPRLALSFVGYLSMLAGLLLTLAGAFLYNRARRGSADG